MSRNLDALSKDLIHILSESQDYVLTLKDMCEIENSTLDRHIANCSKMIELLQKESSEESGTLSAHESICKELTDLYNKKNADYGDSFHKTFLEEGFAMPRIRLSDKLERFKKLSKGSEVQVKTESMRDTLLDLANYSILTIMELDSE